MAKEGKPGDRIEGKMEKEGSERDRRSPGEGYGSGPRWESGEERSKTLWDGRNQFSELGKERTRRAETLCQRQQRGQGLSKGW